MGDGAARVYRIERGSLVVIEGMHAPSGMVEQLTNDLARRVGHEEFLVLVVPPPGTAQVMPAGGLLDWLAAQGIHLEDTDQGPVLHDTRPVG